MALAQCKGKSIQVLDKEQYYTILRLVLDTGFLINDVYDLPYALQEITGIACTLKVIDEQWIIQTIGIVNIKVIMTSGFWNYGVNIQ